MKRTITLLFLLSAMLLAKGNHLSSDFNLRMHNGAFFTVVFDNVPYYQPVNQFSLNDINPGCHFITVYKMQHHGYYQTYPVKVYSGKVEIPAASAVNAVVKKGCLDIVSVIALCPPVPAPYVQNCSYQQQNWIMSEAEYCELRDIIGNKAFDSSRLAIARDAVKNRQMSSRQVAGLMDLLSFDSSRLELAKFAYKYVVDPSAYYLTYDEFTFESSVNELIDYINRFS